MSTVGNLSASEFILELLSALKDLPLEDHDGRNQIASFLYIPDKDMPQYLNELKQYLEINNPTKMQRQNAGVLLEQIATLAFGSLQGITSIKSFRSAGPQYDLLVGGDDYQWLMLCDLLFMKKDQRDIVVEAKCTLGKVNDQQFARLCSILETNISITTGIGVFFTLNGATGFPTSKDDTRKKALSEARLRQALFYARTKKAIVVLNKNDIFKLDQPASLIQIMQSKIREIDHLSGLYVEACDSPIETDLPQHLKFIKEKLMSKNSWATTKGGISS